MNLSKGLLYTLLATLFSAFAIVTTRAALVQGENALNFTAWTISLTALPWLFLFRKHTTEFKKLSRKTLFLLLFIGIASSIGINYLQALALAYSPATNFSFLYRTVIIFTIIFAWLFFKEPITKKKGLLVLIILIGSYLLTTNGQGLQFSTGDIYSILMAASAALVANILVKHTISKMHTDLSASVTMVIASISLLLFAAITNVLSMPQNMWLILFGAIFQFFLIFYRNRAYKHASASFVTMTFALAPLYVTLLSYLFLGERLSPVELMGGTLIVGSVFFVQRLKI